MRIAVPYEVEGGNIDQHMGHAKAFKIYGVSAGKVELSDIVKGSVSSEHLAVAAMLMSYGVSVVLCGSFGQGMKEACEMMGMEIYGGFEGKADDAVEKMLAGDLKDDPRVTRQANCRSCNSSCGSGCSSCSSCGGGCS